MQNTLNDVSRDIVCCLMYVKSYSFHNHEFLRVISMETKLAILKRSQDDSNVVISSVPYSVGRCRTADFIIAHVNVSRNHCQVVRENELWKINDFSSSGTFINGKLIGKGESAILNNGDEIRFGPVESNLSWSFHSFTPSKNEIDLKDKSQPRTELDLNDENCLLKENYYSNEVYVMNKLDDNLKEEQKVTQSSDLKPTKITNEVKLKENEQKTEADINRITEGFQEKETPSKIKEEQKEESSESKKIQELTKELEQIQSALNQLEEKNKRLAEEARNNNEISAPSNFVESVTDLMETELQCTICSELFVTAVTLSCTHTFCKYCINLWKKKQKTCPICRKKITNETRSLVVDNYIDKMVENLSSELKLKRLAIVKERSEIGSVKKRAKIKN